jgi:hypothetical protein
MGREVDTGGARGARQKALPRELAGVGRALQGARQVVLRLGVAAGEAGTSEAQDEVDLRGGYAATEQGLGDPEVRDAPVRLREALRNAEAIEEAVIDGGGGRWGEMGGACFGVSRRGWRSNRTSLRAARAHESARSFLEQRVGVRSPLRLRVQESDPGSVPAELTARGFLVGETRQSSQMAPVGAGRITAIEVCQVAAEGGRQGRFEWRGADAQPSLEMPRAGLENDTRLVAVGAHALQRAWAGGIQVQQDVAGILLAGIGSEVHIGALRVVEAQQADQGGLQKLTGGPHRLERHRFASVLMDQPKLVEIAGHGGELPANGLQGDEESAVHARGLAWA